MMNRRVASTSKGRAVAIGAEIFRKILKSTSDCASPKRATRAQKEKPLSFGTVALVGPLTANMPLRGENPHCKLTMF